MQHDRTKDLLVIRAHAGGAARCLTSGGENLWQLLVECRLERITFEGAHHRRDCINACTNLAVGRRLHLVGARIDGVKDRLEATKLAIV